MFPWSLHIGRHLRFRQLIHSLITKNHNNAHEDKEPIAAHEEPNQRESRLRLEIFDFVDGGHIGLIDSLDKLPVQRVQPFHLGTSLNPPINNKHRKQISIRNCFNDVYTISKIGSKKIKDSMYIVKILLLYG